MAIRDRSQSEVNITNIETINLGVHAPLETVTRYAEYQKSSHDGITQITGWNKPQMAEGSDGTSFVYSLSFWENMAI